MPCSEEYLKYYTEYRKNAPYLECEICGRKYKTCYKSTHLKSFYHQRALIYQDDEYFRFLIRHKIENPNDIKHINFVLRTKYKMEGIENIQD